MQMAIGKSLVQICQVKQLQEKNAKFIIMRNFIALFIVLMCNTLFAQSLPVLTTSSLAEPNDDDKITKNGNYAKDTNNERDQYVGLWEYNQNGILFQLKIDKDDKALDKIEYNGEISNYNYCDQIILRYKLVKNGVLIYDNLNEPAVDNVTSHGRKLASYNFLDGRILDYTRNVVGYYTMQKLAGNPAKIKFNLLLGNYIMLNSYSYYLDGQPLFSIPINGVEMTKIN
jgi:hypothetical protein